MDPVCLRTVAGVKDVDVFVVVATEQLLPVVGIDEAGDVGTLGLILRSHLVRGIGQRGQG